MKRLIPVILTLLALPLGAAVKAEDPFASETVRRIQALHDKAVEGDAEDTDRLVAEVEALLKAHPDNALYLAYLGSGLTLKSRDAFPGPSKFSFLKTGLKTMDKAVDMDANNPAPRFIRAMNNFNLPAIINRRDNARADFSLLLKQIEDPKSPYRLRDETRQAIYYFAGLSFRQLDRPREAREAWIKGRALSGTPEITQKLTAALADLDG